MVYKFFFGDRSINQKIWGGKPGNYLEFILYY